MLNLEKVSRAITIFQFVRLTSKYLLITLKTIPINWKWLFTYFEAI
jgi:hypothetical protein